MSHEQSFGPPKEGDKMELTVTGGGMEGEYEVTVQEIEEELLEVTDFRFKDTHIVIKLLKGGGEDTTE